MVSMTYENTTELIEALDEVRGQRPGTVSWVDAAQRVFDALGTTLAATSAPHTDRHSDTGRAIAETSQRYGRTSRSKLMMRQREFWTALDRLAMSQNAAARAAGISSGYLSSLVQGKRGAGRETAARLAEAVGVSHNELFVREVA